VSRHSWLFIDHAGLPLQSLLTILQFVFCRHSFIVKAGHNCFFVVGFGVTTGAAVAGVNSQKFWLSIHVQQVHCSHALKDVLIEQPPLGGISIQIVGATVGTRDGWQEASLHFPSTQSQPDHR
jgi:hypothetical protein